MSYCNFSQENLWCIGWQNNGVGTNDKKNLTILGGMLLVWTRLYVDYVILGYLLTSSMGEKGEVLYF